MQKLEINHSTASGHCIGKLLSTIYEIPQVKGCILIQSKSSDIYKLVTRDYDLIFKVHGNNLKTIDELNFEVKALVFLSVQKAGIAKPIIGRDGSYISKVKYPEGIRFGVLYTFVKGRNIDPKNSNDYFLYGKSLAEIHSVDISKLKFNIEFDVSKQIIESCANIRSLINTPGNIYNGFMQMKEMLLDEVDKLDIVGLRQGFCHGDSHGGNCAIYNSKVIFYDFEHAVYGFQAYDLATFRWGCRVLRNERPYLEFIKGYSSIRDLPYFDMKHSLLFVAVRELWVINENLKKADFVGRNYFSDNYFENRLIFLNNTFSKGISGESQ